MLVVTRLRKSTTEVKRCGGGGNRTPVKVIGYTKNTGVKTYFDADADFITDGIMIRPSWGPDCSEVKIPSGVIGLGAHCFLNCSAITFNQYTRRCYV